MKNDTGYNFIIPTFAKIGAETPSYNLQDIKLIGAVGDGKKECIYVYDDQAVVTGDQYYWCEPGKVSGVEIPKAGWYKYRGKGDVEDIPLPLGTGLYLYVPNTGVTPQYSGQVFEGKLTNEFPNVGYNMVGNSSPVSIHVQDIQLVNAAGDGKKECIYMYDDQAVVTGDQYYWCEPGKVSGAEIPKAGWYKYRGKGEIENFEIKSGEGIYIYVPNAGVSFTIPSAL